MDSATDTDFKISEELNSLLQEPDFFDKLQSQILKELRGKKSQTYMNRRLNYTFNQYAKWENGTKDISWKDLVKICDALGLELKQNICSRYTIPLKDFNNSGVLLLEFYLKIFFKNKITALAKYLELSVPALRRLLREEVEISFSHILKLFFYRPVFLFYFFNELNIIKAFPEIEHDFMRMNSLEKLEAQYPFVSAVLYYVDTTDYVSLPKHNSNFIAKNTGLKLAQVELGLAELEKRKLIIFKKNKYQFTFVGSEQISLTVKERVQIMNYWYFRGLSYLDRKTRGPQETKTANHSSYRVFTCTKEAAKEIQEKLAKVYYEINQTLKDNIANEGDEVVLKAYFINYFGIEESAPVEFKMNENLGFHTE